VTGSGTNAAPSCTLSGWCFPNMLEWQHLIAATVDLHTAKCVGYIHTWFKANGGCWVGTQSKVMVSILRREESRRTGAGPPEHLDTRRHRH
jgi:hypothetical protein